MLERIPYVDLALLPHYKDPYYDESGDKVDMKREKGTNIVLNTATKEDIEEIVNGRIEKAVPKVVNEALEFQEL